MRFLEDYVMKVDPAFPKRTFQIAGGLGWTACLTFYVLLVVFLNEEEANYERVFHFALSLAALHVLELGLVLRDAFGYAGSNVLLQTLVIGNGSFITFGHAAILGYIMAMNFPDNVFLFSLLSLITACISNALMLALLFKLFHESTKRVFNVGQNKDNKSSTSVNTLMF